MAACKCACGQGSAESVSATFPADREGFAIASRSPGVEGHVNAMTEEPQKLYTPILETARLILRPPRMDDAPAVQKRFGRWEIVQHLLNTVPWPYPDDG